MKNKSLSCLNACGRRHWQKSSLAPNEALYTLDMQETVCFSLRKRVLARWRTPFLSNGVWCVLRAKKSYGSEIVPPRYSHLFFFLWERGQPQRFIDVGERKVIKKARESVSSTQKNFLHHMQNAFCNYSQPLRRYFLKVVSYLFIINNQ